MPVLIRIQINLEHFIVTVTDTEAFILLTTGPTFGTEVNVGITPATAYLDPNGLITVAAIGKSKTGPTHFWSQYIQSPDLIQPRKNQGYDDWLRYPEYIGRSPD